MCLHSSQHFVRSALLNIKLLHMTSNPVVLRVGHHVLDLDVECPCLNCLLDASDEVSKPEIRLRRPECNLTRVGHERTVRTQNVLSGSAAVPCSLPRQHT